MMIRVRILLKPTVFTVKFVFEMNESKQKEAGVGPFKKHNLFGAVESSAMRAWYLPFL